MITTTKNAVEPVLFSGVAMYLFICMVVNIVLELKKKRFNVIQNGIFVA